MNLALNLETQLPDPDVVAIWASKIRFNSRQLDCLTTLMLKILDGKCKMEQSVQDLVVVIYQSTVKEHVELFDPAVHEFIWEVRKQRNPVTSRQLHELRLYAEQAIPQLVMKQFKRDLWQILPDG